MKEQPSSSLLFHALSTNHSRPAKEDTDTDKLKNLFRLMKDKSREEQAVLQVTITSQWDPKTRAAAVQPVWCTTWVWLPP